MFKSNNYILIIVLIPVLIEVILLGSVETTVVGKNLDSQKIFKSEQTNIKDYSSKDVSLNQEEFPSSVAALEVGLWNGFFYQNRINHARVKRSPYPPGFVIWSAPSEVLPCNCSPGQRKCKCLGLLERIVLLAQKRKRIVVRRRA